MRARTLLLVVKIVLLVFNNVPLSKMTFYAFYAFYACDTTMLQSTYVSQAPSERIKVAIRQQVF